MTTVEVKPLFDTFTHDIRIYRYPFFLNIVKIRAKLGSTGSQEQFRS
jgi:hypothetical protein